MNAPEWSIACVSKDRPSEFSFWHVLLMGDANEPDEMKFPLNLVYGILEHRFVAI